MGGKLARLGGSITIGGQAVTIKPLPSKFGEPLFERGFLYQYFVEERRP